MGALANRMGLIRRRREHFIKLYITAEINFITSNDPSKTLKTGPVAFKHFIKHY